MRLKYMYHLLKDNYDSLESLLLESDTYKVSSTSNSRGKVINWQSGREALVNVSVIPCFKEFCFFILDNPYFAKEQDTFYIPYESYQNIYLKYASFLGQVKSIIEFFEASEFDTVETGFDIKMPPTDNFDEFAKNIELLNKVINQCPYLTSKSESIILKKTDIGSIWFEFAVMATSASVILTNLAKLVDKCVKIKSHYITTKQQKEQLRSLSLKNDILETMLNAYDEVTNGVIDKCINELKQEIPDVKLENEDVTRVKFSLETLSNLMEKGMEIYASIDAPKDIQALFPTSDEMVFLPKPQELLEESNE